MTSLELSFGFSAFTIWCFEARGKDASFIQNVNATAREIAIGFMAAVFSNRHVLRALEERSMVFFPHREIEYAQQGMSADNHFWRDSLTRIVIMICRSLAYELTGVLGGDELKFIQHLKAKDLAVIAQQMLEQDLDSETAFLVLNPSGR